MKLVNERESISFVRECLKIDVTPKCVTIHSAVIGFKDETAVLALEPDFEPNARTLPIEFRCDSEQMLKYLLTTVKFAVTSHDEFARRQLIQQ
ncbi:hypothetical protein GJ496_000278 [Pomphorhynchus laevis]|nr:hypothetical protein GJ496_000278 [Pomphorhynchus laevis]